MANKVLTPDLQSAKNIQRDIHLWDSNAIHGYCRSIHWPVSFDAYIKTI